MRTCIPWPVATELPLLGAALCAGILALSVCAVAEEGTMERYRTVRELLPLGYWPADEGAGEILHDRSGNDNHGRLFNLGWQGGLLDFTSGFHWAEIPGRPAYRADRITVGGWFFTRRDDYLGGSDLQGPNRNAADNHHTHGVSLINNAYGRRGGWVRWDGIDTVRDGLGLRLRSPGASRSVGGALFDVVHGSRADVLDSALEGLSMPANRWQHVLYTFAEGVGRLYLDGRLATEKEGVVFVPSDRSYVVGNDMSWWMLYPNGSQSLDGSVRDIVLFDRVLAPEEVARLLAATRPGVSPRIYGADDIVIDGRHISLDDLAVVSPDERRRALEHLGRRKPERIRALPASLVPMLDAALADWRTRVAAARLLVAYEDESARTALQAERFVAILRREDLPAQDRASAALALAAMGARATAAVPELVGLLRAVVEREGEHLPRTEDLVRNGLLRALLDIAPQHPEVRGIVGLALAKPVLSALDLSAGHLAEVRDLVEAGRHLDALEAFRALPPREHGHFYLSQGDRHRDARQGTGRDYSSIVEHDGITYKVGSGKAWDAADRMDAEDYREAVAELPPEHREDAAKWTHATSPSLYQVRIHRIDRQGRTETVFLEGKWFVFLGSDAKLLGWTIDIDEKGHIHLLGGMHNSPHPGNYLPGSWEKMGLSRNRADDSFPSVMYWVSSRPGDIRSFEFVGQRRNPRNLPAPGMNYMNLVRDPGNTMFLYGRIGAQGTQSWGFYRYDAAAGRWGAIGGRANDVHEAVRQEWGDIFVQRGGTPWKPQPFVPSETVFVWAWHPHFYNYIRGWGVRFDPAGRMHVRVPIRGLGTASRIRDGQVYAYSDDRGETFFRADGTPLKLPLTTNPAPGHHADLDHHFSGHWLNLWHSLLRDAGYNEY